MARSWPKGFDPENPECPKCQGPMYDNREDKKSPKMPDFRCKDKECVDENERVTGVWGPTTPRAAKKKAGEAEGAVPAAPTPRYNFTPEEKLIVRRARVADYLALMQTVKNGMVKVALSAQAPIACDMGNVQAATFSLWGDLKSCGALRDPAVIVATARHRGELGAAAPAPAATQANGNGAAPTAAIERMPARTPTEVPGEAPVPRAVAARAAGRPPLVDTTGGRGRQLPADFEEFPSALEASDDDLPF